MTHFFFFIAMMMMSFNGRGARWASCLRAPIPSSSLGESKTLQVNVRGIGIWFDDDVYYYST